MTLNTVAHLIYALDKLPGAMLLSSPEALAVITAATPTSAPAPTLLQIAVRAGIQNPELIPCGQGTAILNQVPVSIGVWRWKSYSPRRPRGSREFPIYTKY